ncbi:outer membrane protein [Burkholderiales bacterium JOSHI_001]|nr:outer membrane protein [Burkholderiales bacterium JOSHI_001]
MTDTARQAVMRFQIANKIYPLVATAAAVMAFASTRADAACIDTHADAPTEGASPMAVGEPRERLQAMANQALSRSAQVGAAKLLGEAALADLAETRAATRPLASLNANLGAQGASTKGLASTSGVAAGAALSVSAPLFDSGRNAALVDWRSAMADAARLGQLSAQEQVVFQTVAMALDRNRYRLQTQVYDQYGRKMECLVDALKQIVAADKGRASELVQARKSLQQAELMREQAATALAQAEVRLRRFVGDPLPSGEGITSVLMRTPDPVDVIASMPAAPDVAGLRKQVEAAKDYARAVEAGNKLQVGWTAGARGAAGGGASETKSFSAGITVNVPLFNAGAEHAQSAAKLRATAIARQLEDVLDARKSRVYEVHSQATSALDRAKRVSEVLRDSDTLRNVTVQQWRQLGRRSLFDVMAAEGDHYNLRVSYINALYDALQANAMMYSLGTGLNAWLMK